jgi:hypothetical protein
MISSARPCIQHVPGNFKRWIRRFRLGGLPVAGYVSFGGEGGNQHNTACTLLTMMSEKVAFPGMGLLGTCHLTRANQNEV